MDIQASSSQNSESGTRLIGAKVLDEENSSAEIVAVNNTGKELMISLRTDDGLALSLPWSLVEMQGDAYRVPASFASMSTRATSNQDRSIPVWQEELNIDTQVVDTGKGVRISKRVLERGEKVDLSLLHDEIKVEHVPIGRYVADGQIPLSRQDGDTYIIPVLEEILVVEKKLYLKEEVHVIKRQREVQSTQTVPLKSEEVSIERFDEGRPESD